MINKIINAFLYILLSHRSTDEKDTGRYFSDDGTAQHVIYERFIKLVLDSLVLKIIRLFKDRHPTPDNHHAA
ncbi:MAG: hypothetical protein JW944_15305 [Deltaproteobacteria bacterium]|nr:hypothetical protein [Deltaproteobacteria bacterium]